MAGFDVPLIYLSSTMQDQENVYVIDDNAFQLSGSVSQAISTVDPRFVYIKAYVFYPLGKTK